MEILDFAILTFTSLIVIVDPISTLPAFIAMTRRNSTEERVRMAGLASIVTFFVLVVSYIGGLQILAAFGITITAFEIAGGIILLIIALDMLQARRTAIKETPEEQAEGVSKDDIAITPLAMPMLAGPGAITAVILLSSQATSFVHHSIALLSILLVALLTFFVLWLAAQKSSFFKPITMKIITRVMGLLLAAIAVQFIINGLQNIL